MMPPPGWVIVEFDEFAATRRAFYGQDEPTPEFAKLCADIIAAVDKGDELPGAPLPEWHSVVKKLLSLFPNCDTPRSANLGGVQPHALLYTVDRTAELRWLILVIIYPKVP